MDGCLGFLAGLLWAALFYGAWCFYDAISHMPTCAGLGGGC